MIITEEHRRARARQRDADRVLRARRAAWSDMAAAVEDVARRMRKNVLASAEVHRELGQEAATQLRGIADGIERLTTT